MVVMRERRSEVRMMCADLLAITWKGRNGRAHQDMALLEDISASGACLQLETAVPVGAEVEWKCPRQQFTGRVQYCVYREIGYFVGVAFEKTTKWSRGKYRPRHLLDLQKLVKDARLKSPRGLKTRPPCLSSGAG